MLVKIDVRFRIRTYDSPRTTIPSPGLHWHRPNHHIGSLNSRGVPCTLYSIERGVASSAARFHKFATELAPLQGSFVNFTLRHVTLSPTPRQSTTYFSFVRHKFLKSSCTDFYNAMCYRFLWDSLRTLIYLKTKNSVTPYFITHKEKSNLKPTSKALSYILEASFKHLSL